MDVKSETQKLLRPVKEHMLELFHSFHKADEKAERKAKAFNSEESSRLLLKDAVQSEASDIHMEPFSGGIRIRLRIDGVLHDTAILVYEEGEKLIRHFKSIAGLDPVGSFKPQDARTKVDMSDRTIDIRLACVPCQGGEKLVMRILDPFQIEHRIQELGFSRQHQQEIEQWLGNISGMCLVAGPTGSGKTTTLYAILHELKLHSKSITTIEDPVEYSVDGITQLQVNHRHGLDFSEGIKAMLRMDPDYLLVGEIRDYESARAAVEASASGRVLMSTLHSRDTAGVISSLRNWDLLDYEIATNLELVVAQRLVRKLCKKCRVQEAPNEQEKNWFKLLGIPVPKKTWHAKGCKLCRKTGYRGRTGVFEIWRKSEKDHDLILLHSDEASIRKQLRGQGRKSLLDDGLDKTREGITTLEEVQRMNYYMTGINSLAPDIIDSKNTAAKHPNTAASKLRHTKPKS